MTDLARINFTPGQLPVCLNLRSNSALSSCTEVDGDTAGNVWIDRNWPSLSTGEELLWSVLAWLNGQGECPPDGDLAAGLDGDSLAAARVAVAVGSGVSA